MSRLLYCVCLGHPELTRPSSVPNGRKVFNIWMAFYYIRKKVTECACSTLSAPNRQTAEIVIIVYVCLAAVLRWRTGCATKLVLRSPLSVVFFLYVCRCKNLLIFGRKFLKLKYRITIVSTEKYPQAYKSYNNLWKEINVILHIFAQNWFFFKFFFRWIFIERNDSAIRNVRLPATVCSSSSSVWRIISWSI